MKPNFFSSITSRNFVLNTQPIQLATGAAFDSSTYRFGEGQGQIEVSHNYIDNASNSTLMEKERLLLKNITNTHFRALHSHKKSLNNRISKNNLSQVTRVKNIVKGYNNLEPQLARQLSTQGTESRTVQAVCSPRQMLSHQLQVAKDRQKLQLAIQKRNRDRALLIKPEISRKMYLSQQRRRISPAPQIRFFSYMNASEVHSLIHKILKCYSHLQGFGYSNHKISLMVRAYCQEKKDLETTFLKVKKHNPLTNAMTYEHKSNFQEIYATLVQLATSKRGKQIDQLLNDLVQFKERLEWDIISRAQHKISDLRKSIIVRTEDILEKQHIMHYQQDLTINVESQETIEAKNSVLAVLEHMKNFQEKYSPYQGVSKINRTIFRQIVRTEGDIEAAVNSKRKEYEGSTFNRVIE